RTSRPGSRSQAAAKIIATPIINRMVLLLFDMCAVARRSPGEAHQQETCRFDREVKGGIIQRHLTRARRGSISCGGPGGRDWPSWVRRQNRNRMLDVGDKIAVQFGPALNGSALGVLRSIILPDGRTIWILTAQPPTRRRRGMIMTFRRTLIWTSVAFAAALTIGVPSMAGAQAG